MQIIPINLLFMVYYVSAVTLELFELPGHTYPQAVCNDGTVAVYYHDTDYSKLGKIHVDLEGGNLCDSDETCLARCDRDNDGEVDNHYCTASTGQSIQMNKGLFSSDEENPLHDFWHVHVPYCTSDTWAGTGYSEQCRYFFHGKHVFHNVMNSLSHHFNLFQASEFVLSGSSAGGFGVGLNCDNVAEWLHANNPDMNVWCVADAPDFIPWWVHTENCPRRANDYQHFVNSFWSRDMDHSCQEFAYNLENNVTKPEEMCGILSQSLSFITTNIFISVSLQDTAIGPDYSCPQQGAEDEVLLPWMSGMEEMVTAATETMPGIGWFVPICPLHAIFGGEEKDLLVRDIHTGEEFNAFTALAKWMQGDIVHAIDSLEDGNDCP